MRTLVLTVAAVCVAAGGLFWPREASPHNPITTTVLFNREISTVFQQKCLQCHAPGGLAMSLATYDDARPWAVSIKEEILSRRMPPWPAERGYGDFANDLGLTERERDFLVSWIDGGVPKGDGEAPAYLDHSTHWMLGAPEAELKPPAGVTVEAGGPARFTRLVLDTALRQERWLRALDFKPDKRVARAAFLSVADTGQYLGAWTPWRSSVQMPDGVGIRLPARARIAIDVLYQPTNTAAPDRPSGAVVDTPTLGLYFAPSRPARQMTTTVLAPALVAAPPSGSAAPRVTATLVVAGDTAVVEMRPEMGPGARSLEVKVKRPDGSIHVPLWIRRFRQDWQTSYVFRQPLALPRGSVVSTVAYFDPAASAGQGRPSFTLTINGYDPAPGALTAGPGPLRPATTR